MRANDRIDELVANEMMTAQQVYDYLATIRLLHQKLAVETSLAAPHLRALLLYTPAAPHTSSRKGARRVYQLVKRLSEMEVACAALSTKTWAALTADFLIKTKKAPAKKGLELDM